MVIRGVLQPIDRRVIDMIRMFSLSINSPHGRPPLPLPLSYSGIGRRLSPPHGVHTRSAAAGLSSTLHLDRTSSSGVASASLGFLHKVITSSVVSVAATILLVFGDIRIVNVIII